jgi:hypothetical protein
MVSDLQPHSTVFHADVRLLTRTITPIALLLTASVSYAASTCGQPASSGRRPTASDALFVLRTTVALERCDACVCDVDGDGTTTTSDALTLLPRRRGQ